MGGIYIHIPLCSQRCNYCDFFSSLSKGENKALVEAIVREIMIRASEVGELQLSTIYIGGGTPSRLMIEQVGEILKMVYSSFRCDAIQEVTMEVNPDDLSLDYLKGIRNLGVNRLSIGIQSFDDQMLRFLNRRHDSNSARRAVKMAREVGFDNISIDLIYGIPGLSNDMWQETIDMAVSLSVEHISAYHLTIESGTEFGRRLQKGELTPVDEEVGCVQYNILRERLALLGYEHYEISNFAKRGWRSKHNSSYWCGIQYIGIGPSAHSYDGKRCRRWNVASIERYIDGLDKGEYFDFEELSDTDLHNERIMTALRCGEGLNLERFNCDFGAEALEQLLVDVKVFVDCGWCEVSDGYVRVVPEHFMQSDNIISRLFS